MKNVILRSIVCGLALTLTGGAALAQSGQCEGLQEATPGLYGLCIAFHSVEPCEPNPFADDPYANCEAKDGRLLAEYNALREEDDPLMPGTGDTCPCFTREQVLTWAEESQPYDMCAIDQPYEFHSNPNWPWSLYITSIWNAAWGAQTNVNHVGEQPVQIGKPGMCQFYAPDTPFCEITAIRYEEFVACHDIIVEAIENNVDYCLELLISD